MLSFEHQFIFIKTKKTGGSSIEEYLSNFLGKDDLYMWNHISSKENHGGLYNHIGAEEFCKTKYGKYWNNFTTITAVRHPMDRLISEFFWSDRNGGYDGNFDRFLKDKAKINSTNNHRLIKNVEFGFLIYYENYINDINKVLEYLGLPTVNKENFPQLKSQERKDRRPWHEFMRQDQIDYFKKNFPEEIEMHRKLGYKI